VQAFNRAFIARLLDTLQRASAGAAGPGGLNVVSAACGLLMQLLEFLPSAKPDVMNALAFKPEVPSPLPLPPVLNGHVSSLLPY
jgi:hypothetical protein